MFLLEPFFTEEGADVGQFYYVTERLCLCLQFSALQADDTIRQGVALGLADILTDNLHKVRKRHDSPADHKIIFAFLVFPAQMYGLTIGKAYRLTYFLGDTNLLAGAIDQPEPAFWKKDG